MALSQRLCGPVLANVSSATLFAGVDELERMKALRRKITDIRRIWNDTEAFNNLKSKIQNHIDHENLSPKIASRISSLLAGYSDWADMDYNRPEKQLQSFTAIELYCSEEGYNLIFGILNAALRQKEIDEDILLIAAALVEFVTIELYNLRLANIGDPRYENYEGITFRGMCVSKEMGTEYRKAASSDDLSKRHFGVPLGFTSSTVSKNITEEFVKKYPLEDQMHWIIHICGLDPLLAKMYQERYPDSVVTSITAMPVGRVAELREKEILLRGAFFHIVNMESKECDGRTIHTLQLVVMNTNRDHGTELALDEGAKQEQRNFFRDMIMASRFQICADLVKQHNDDESTKYKQLARMALERINSTVHLDTTPRNGRAFTKISTTATWYGDMSGSSFPGNYLALRHKFHLFAKAGEWNEVKKILEGEYDWQVPEWFNLPALDTENSSQRYTLLNQMANHGPPVVGSKHQPGWEYLLKELKVGGSQIWKTQKTADKGETPECLAKQNGHDELAGLLRPRIERIIEESLLGSVQTQLNQLIQTALIDYEVHPGSFAMPQVSILRENPQTLLWIPIPRMYGGFLLSSGDVVQLRKFENVKGETKPRITEYLLD